MGLKVESADHVLLLDSASGHSWHVDTYGNLQVFNSAKEKMVEFAAGKWLCVYKPFNEEKSDVG